ncbi:ABC transporter ATP-binding protein [Mycetocola spongiae]|uniref:ABC transporter ATP-binding protein n=1 Tax=Mycetocola spongiae TaxID=2859226 RepID=UPI001CF1C885|nr:ABC transporter ATP-binding protein [Mycetocola spongiae]UCR89389.1 ABC transporter ATP-binding protein/permease [Mycetocola spongiae]
MTSTFLTLPIADARETRAAVAHLMRTRRGLLGAALLTLLLGSAVSLLTPLLLGMLVDAVRDSAATSALLWLGGGLLASGVLGALIVMAGSVLMARLVHSALAELREGVLDAALRIPIGQVEAAGSGDLVSRVTGDVEAVGEAASGILPGLTASAFAIGVTIVGLGVLDLRLAAAALIAVPLQWWVTARFIRRSRPVYREVRAAEAARSQHTLEAVTAADTIRALGSVEHHRTLVDASSAHAVELQRRAVALRTRFFGGLNAAEYLGLASVLTVGFILVSLGEVSVGAATAAALYFLRLFGPIGQLLSSIDELQRAGIGLARLVGVMNLPLPAARPEPVAPGAGGVEITISGLDYGYDAGRAALSDIHLSVAAGENIALVGASGAGKSTLARLIAGLLEADRGALRLTRDAEPFRGRPYLLSQEVHAFDGTLREDLLLAGPTRGEAEVLAALNAVGAQWVHTLPEGLATRIGASGEALDHARLQQLALARLLLADPPLVVLDEATSEAGSGGALERAAETVLAGRTSVVVAHRLSQARAADRIAMMDAGRIVELGSHEELLAAGGLYANLWAAWARERG